MAESVRGAGQPTWQLSPYNITMALGSGHGITRGNGADWFGPLEPLRPIAPPEVAGRRFDYAPGYNLLTRPRGYEPVGFHELRAFAETYDLVRLVIEHRKDQIERLRWAIRPRDEKLKSASQAQKRIDVITEFFKKPDGWLTWKTWLRGLLEDLFVIDAPTLYCQRSRNGKLLALLQLDGATIKPVIDDWGRTPLPFNSGGTLIYPPAYQQILKGFPAVDYSVRDIIYAPRNIRAHRVYGYSPVQQILMTVQIGLRRQLWQLDYYTEGSIPDALIGVPNDWTPEQIRAFQDYWDTEFSGDLAKRRRAKFVPGDTVSKFKQTKEPEQHNLFDEWLARIVCYAFSIPPQWAVRMMNRAQGENQDDIATEEGIETVKEWIKELIDRIVADEFESPDLELAWTEEDDIDPSVQQTVLDGRVRAGAITLNEYRANIGADPYDDPAADVPMVMTPNGYVPINANIGISGDAHTDAVIGDDEKDDVADEDEQVEKRLKTRKIMLIRHGATKLNNDDVSVDRIRGHKDIPLSDDGREEAKRLAAKIAKNPPDVIVSSDLKRAHDTAKIIADASDMSVSWVSKSFRPWDVGDFTGKKSSDAVPKMIEYARDKPDEPVPNGESFNAFVSRFLNGVLKAINEYDGVIAIVAHHRNERILHGWEAADFADDGAIDMKVFGRKGEATGSVTTLDIPVVKLRKAAKALAGKSKSN